MPHVVKLPPNTLRNGDVITIRATITTNSPENDVFPLIKDVQLDSIEIDRAKETEIMPQLNNGAPVTSEAGYHAQPAKGVELVPFSPTCDISGCEERTIAIVQTVRHLTYEGEARTAHTSTPLTPQLETFWLPVCQGHSKAQMDYAMDMLGHVYFMVVRTDRDLTTGLAELR